MVAFLGHTDATEKPKNVVEVTRVFAARKGLLYMIMRICMVDTTLVHI